MTASAGVRGLKKETPQNPKDMKFSKSQDKAR